MSGQNRNAPASPGGTPWSDTDNAPLIGEKAALKLSKSFSERHGARKDLSAKSRVLPGPGRAQPRKWMRIDSHGALSYIAADKHTLVMELGIPYRDLRVLDPLIASSYPTAILIRERALVINMESVRMIVCQDQVLLQNVPSPQHSQAGVFPTSDSPFIIDLKTRLAHSGSNLPDERTLHMDATLPFELVAVEAALASCAKNLEQEATDLEHRAEPSLVRLSQKVSRKELENVKNYKAALNRLLARVSKVKTVVEAILDDDQDMEDMNLGRRAETDQLLAAADYNDHFDNPPEDEAPASPRSPRHEPGSARHAMSQRQDLFDIDEGVLDAEKAEEGVTGGADRHSLESSVLAAERTGPSFPGSFTNKGHRRSASTHPILASAGSGIPPANANDDTVDEDGQLLSSTSKSDSPPTADLGTLKARIPRTSTQPRMRPINKQGSITLQEGGGMATLSRLTRRTSEGDGFWMDGTKTVLWPRKAALEVKRDIEATEDLLDAYFMQVDHTFSRLNVLKERIESIEALVTIDLDHRRNELVAFDLVLTMVTLSLTFMAMIASIFGQNLYFSGAETTVNDFLWATMTSLGVAVMMLVFLLAYARMKRLLFIPTPHSSPMDSGY